MTQEVGYNDCQLSLIGWAHNKKSSCTVVSVSTTQVDGAVVLGAWGSFSTSVHPLVWSDIKQDNGSSLAMARMTRIDARKRELIPLPAAKQKSRSSKVTTPSKIKHGGKIVKKLSEEIETSAAGFAKLYPHLDESTLERIQTLRGFPSWLSISTDDAPDSLRNLFKIGKDYWIKKKEWKTIKREAVEKVRSENRSVLDGKKEDEVSIRDSGNGSATDSREGRNETITSMFVGPDFRGQTQGEDVGGTGESSGSRKRKRERGWNKDEDKTDEGGPVCNGRSSGFLLKKQDRKKKDGECRMSSSCEGACFPNGSVGACFIAHPWDR